MKLIAILIAIGVIEVYSNTYSQTAPLISINLQDASIEKVLDELKSKSDLLFIYRTDQFKDMPLIDINETDVTVTEILDKYIVPLGFSYEIYEMTVIIKKQSKILEMPKQIAPQPGKKEISGTVTDEEGQSVISASIIVKGTTIGTVTDINGHFSLEVPEESEILVFSYVGMSTQEVKIGTQQSQSLLIVMQQFNTGLEELVVVGFATKKKVNLTGAVGTVNTDMLQSRPVQTLVQSLQGVTSGLNISYTNGGALNASPDINIRGIATIGEGSSGRALVLIDGMEGSLSSINPQDIESISVLKDAASSSIYGSRAPFGVILVTTKRAKGNKTVINYNNNFRFSSPINLPEMMDSYTFAIYMNEANNNAGWGDIFTEERLQRIWDYQHGIITTTTIQEPNSTKWGDGYDYGNDNIDYYKIIYNKWAPAQEHNLSIAGGKENTSYYISSDYLKQNGLVAYGKDEFHRYAITAKIDTKLTGWLKLSYSGRYIKEDFSQPSHLRDQLYEDMARQIWPTKPLYDPNGNLYDDHLIGLRDGGKLKTFSNWLYQQAQIIITPLKGWRIFLEPNLRLNTQHRQRSVNTYYNLDVNGNPGNIWDLNTSVEEDYYFNNYFNNNFYTDYEFNIQESHKFKLMAGFQNEINLYEDLGAFRLGMLNPDSPSINSTTGTSYYGEIVAPAVNGQYTEWTTAGFFGRINYDYQLRYLFEANFRYDGSSRFRKSNRWGFFPSVSAGWNIAEEQFFNPLKKYINYLKLRGSYGALGNQNTNSIYPTYSTMGIGISSGTFVINNQRPNIAWPPDMISSSLTWEKIVSWDLGLDYSLFNTRLRGSFDYFTRFTRDMVGPAIELPAILGTNVPLANNTDMKTWGFEYEIEWKDYLKNGFGYGIRFLLWDSQSSILRYSNPSNSLTKYREGQMLGEIWGYTTVGIAKTQEEMDNHLASLPEGGQSPMGVDWRAGDIMYKDINGDGKINWGENTSDDPGDVSIIGNSTPRYSFGMDLKMNYKGFDFIAFFQGVLKRDIFQDKYYFWGIDGGRGKWFTAGFVQHEDYFRDDPNNPLGVNLDGYYPRALFGTVKNQQVQTRYLQDGKYIRLKNLQIGYTLPATITKKAAISVVRIYFSGENLLTITKMTKIFDPETVYGGYGGSVYPLSRVLSFGMSLTL